MAAGDLTTVDELREYLGLETLDADAILEDLVTASSAWVKGEIGRDILQATYTETVSGDGYSSLSLANYPVISVTSVTVDGVTIPARPAVSSTESNPDGWVLDGDCVELSGYTFTRGLRNVVIVYSAGYATCPTELARAVIKHAAIEYGRRGSLGRGSASVDGQSVSYASDGDWKSIFEVIDRYQRRRL